MPSAPPLRCPVRAHALERPEAPALIGEAGGAVSYAAMDGRVARAARRMRAAGVAPGDRVTLYGPPGADYLAALWALLRLGAVACPLSTRAPAGVLAAQMGGLRSRTLVLLGEPPLDFVLPDDVRALPGANRSDPAAAQGAEAPVAPGASVPLEASRPATAVFTSGSTARPKAALHSVGNHYFSAEGARQNIALGPGHRWLLSLPLYHVGGLAIAFRCHWAGAAVALPPGGAPLGEALKESRATHASMVATQLGRLLREGPALAPGPLRALLLGGGPLPADLVEEAVARGLPVHASYGLTEMASQVTTTPPGASPETLRTAGHLLPHRQLRLAPDGEVLVKGRTLFLGYLGEADAEPADAEGRGASAPRRAVDEDGWYHTGDLGALDAEGRLRLTGRADNLFISGGENVQPEEVEAALCRVPSVVEAVVVPVEDAEFGQRPVAFVRLGKGRVPAEEAPTESVAAGLMNSDELMTAELEHRLPRFKIPKTFHPWPPDAPGGMKVDRAFFRAEAQRRDAQRRDAQRRDAQRRDAQR